MGRVPAVTVGVAVVGMVVEVEALPEAVGRHRLAVGGHGGTGDCGGGVVARAPSLLSSSVDPRNDRGHEDEEEKKKKKRRSFETLRQTQTSLRLINDRQNTTPPLPTYGRRIHSLRRSFLPGAVDRTVPLASPPP